MSYPTVGMLGVMPAYDKWDAAAIEQALRDGHHIYFEDESDFLYGVALFEDEQFKFLRNRSPLELGNEDDEVAFESPSFLELAVWVAFMGRDIL